MGSSRSRHSIRARRRTRRESGTRPPSTYPNLSDISGAIADAASVIETATHAIEATEQHAPAAVTLRVGLRALLDAYARLDSAGGVV